MLLPSRLLLISAADIIAAYAPQPSRDAATLKIADARHDA